MKNVIKKISCIMAVIVTLTFNGCVDANKAVEIYKEINQNEDYIGFDDLKIKTDEVLSYKSPYEDMTASYFKDKLTEEEKELYQAFIYAYDNEYETIRFKYSDEGFDSMIQKVMQSLCAENPFFDWNYDYEFAYNSVRKYYEIHCNTLENNDLSYKAEAYEKAKEIVAEIPEGVSQYEKLTWIYGYVVDNINYVDDLTEYLNNSPKYVYDGLIGKSTQCSGFADSISMLCNISGIESLTVSGKTSEGHAWNLINLDGEFYNCDATNDSGIREQCPEGYNNIWLYFLKSDKLMNSAGYSLIDDTVINFPEAVNEQYDNYNIDISITGSLDDDDLNSIGEALLNKGNYIIVSTNDSSIAAELISENDVNIILEYICENISIDGVNYVTVQTLTDSLGKNIIYFLTTSS